MRRKVFSQLVVVITGASSGIGRATAHEFARKGATLVLIARDDDALADVLLECEERGGRATAVAADVTREQDIQKVTRHTMASHGRIDVWVNNAAVYLLGRFDVVPSDVARRVIETNVIGYFNGARAALRQFRKQGHGVLINVDSVNGAAPQPFSSIYVASKHAIRGWSASLRMELSLEDLDEIHVCNVMPAAIDTPIFQHSANFTGRPIRALDPTYPAEKVARAIVSLAAKPEPEVIVGRAGKAMVAHYTASPRVYEKTMAAYIDRDHFSPGTAKPTEGNLFQSTGPKAVSGGWKTSSNVQSRLMAGIAAAAAGVALTMMIVRSAKRGEE